MFKNLTDSELTALFIRIRTGRDRVNDATGISDLTAYSLVIEASDIMADIHAENAQR